MAAKTYRADQDLPRLMPTSMLALQLSAVSGRDVARSFEALLAVGLAEGSVVRYRASLSSFFSWCVRQKLILSNPVTGVRVPRQSDEADEMDPFSEGELEEVYAMWHAAAPRRHPPRPGLDGSALGGGSLAAGGRCRRSPHTGSTDPSVATGGRRGQVDQGQVVPARPAR
jgi:integrase